MKKIILILILFVTITTSMIYSQKECKDVMFNDVIFTDIVTTKQHTEKEVKLINVDTGVSYTVTKQQPLGSIVESDQSYYLYIIFDHCVFVQSITVYTNRIKNTNKQQ